MTIKSNYPLMRSAIFYLSLLIGIVSCSNSVTLNKEAFHSSQGIHFNDSSLSQAFALASSDNKPVFLMVHANWCSVCKKEKNSVLPEKELGDLYNAHFINAAVDFDSEAGKTIITKYNVSATPTFLYLAPDGHLLSKKSGYMDKEDLVATAKNLKIDGKPVFN